MKTKFVIVGAPRTGSTLLVRTLNTLDGVRCHGELLGDDQVRGYEDGIDLANISQEERKSRAQRLLGERDADPVGFIDRALGTDGTTAGFKALYSAFLNPRWREVTHWLQSLDNIHFIHLTRTNSVRRFVSEQILLQGGPNHSGAGGRSEVPIKIHFDIDAFLRRTAELDAQAAEIRALLSKQDVLETNYEALAADTSAVVKDVCRFLKLDTIAPNIEPALSKVGATDLRDSVSNYQELLDHPATRELALTD
ncbi:MAG: sulfotransferase [Halioglobus sp.]|nr:sulfotransferase [Halioglobus sp.]